MKEYYVYILASGKNGTLYIGVTSDLVRRMYEHRNRLVPGFTNKYSVYMLVHYEVTSDVYSALQREKRLKKWERQWKVNLIEKSNPAWKDLSICFFLDPRIREDDKMVNHDGKGVARNDK